MESLHFYLLFLLFAWFIFIKSFLPKTKNLPPTPLSAISVLSHLSSKQPLHRPLSDIANRYGPILLLPFGSKLVLLISSSEAAKDLFSSNDAAFADRPKLMPGKVFGHDYTNLAWAPHGRRWWHLRRVSCLVLPSHRSEDQGGLMANEVRLLLGRLYDPEKKMVEMKTVFKDLVFDVMMKMFTGKRCCEKKMAEENKIESNTLLDYAIDTFKITMGKTAVGYFMSILKLLGLSSLEQRFCKKKMEEENMIKLHPLLKYATQTFKITTGEIDKRYFMPILKLLGPSGLERKCHALQKEGDLLMDNLIAEIRTKMSILGEKEQSVIGSLLARQNDKTNLYPDEMIRGLVLEFMSAGIDTSAGLLEWALSLLLNHPNVLEKAQKEIEDHLEKTRKETEDHVREPRFLEQSDIDHLPYLRCIVKETLRLYPVAPLLVPHESWKECTVGGYYIPKKTMLMVNVWAIHNDPKIWKDPAQFMPERFEKILGKRDGFDLMPFGVGRRSCPGKHMAVQLVSLALGSLIQCFNWERVSENEVDLAEEMGISLLKVEPLMAICRPRSEMKNLLSKISAN